MDARMQLFELVAYYAIAINFLTFSAFGIDKMLAEGGARRISEARLLSFAFMGGWPGAYAGRHLFRHKTRKRSFSNQLHVIAGLEMAVLAGLAAAPYLT